MLVTLLWKLHRFLVDINEYHTWIKIGEHRIADPRADGYGYFCESHNAIVVEDFKCSVCGEKAREENWWMIDTKSIRMPCNSL